jgi:hypothetical protein
MSVAQFCAAGSLNASQFYWWRRELKRRAGQTQKAGGFVELVRRRSGQDGSGVRIRIDERISIELESGFDEATLKAALRAAVGTAA